MSDLATSIHQGAFDEVMSLLEGRAIDEPVTKDQQTALHLAARFGRVQILDWLLERMAAVNARTTSGMTPLMFAAGGGHLQAIERLLRAGCDVGAVNKWGFTAERVARENGRDEAGKMIASWRS